MRAGGSLRPPLETGFVLLDVVRFSAALMVVFYHYLWFPWIRRGTPAAVHYGEAFDAIAPLAAALWVGVPIFFVLSGVVIAFSAEGRTAGQFIAARALRLYPAAWLCASLTALIIWGAPDLFDRFVRSVLLWPGGPWVSGVYWTLAVEISFYAMAAMAIALAGERGVLRLGMVLAVASSAFWLLRLADFAAGGPFRSIFHAALRTEPYLLVTTGCAFGLGILLYYGNKDGFSRSKRILCLLAAAACLVGLTQNARELVTSWELSPIQIVIPPLLWLAALAVIAAALIPRRSARWLGQWQGPARAVGLATYPLYLVHNELGLAALAGLQDLPPILALLLTLILLATVVAALVAAERAIRNALRSLFTLGKGSGPASISRVE